VNLDGEEIEATVLFTDIRGFTRSANRSRRPRLLRFLNFTSRHITPPIMAHGGVINKFIGDAVMAIFFAGIRSRETRGTGGARRARYAGGSRRFQSMGKFPPVDFGVDYTRGAGAAMSVLSPAASTLSLATW